VLYGVEENPYDENCPVCMRPARSRCRCQRAEFSCPNGHTWFACPIHGLRMGRADHSIPVAPDGCFCGLSLGRRIARQGS